MCTSGRQQPYAIPPRATTVIGCVWCAKTLPGAASHSRARVWVAAARWLGGHRRRRRWPGTIVCGQPAVTAAAALSFGTSLLGPACNVTIVHGGCACPMATARSHWNARIGRGPKDTLSLVPATLVARCFWAAMRQWFQNRESQRGWLKLHDCTTAVPLARRLEERPHSTNAAKVRGEVTFSTFGATLRRVR